jgi:lipopolysaccharide export system protein LptA
MNRFFVGCVLIVLCQLSLAASPATGAAAGEKPTRMTLGSFTIEGKGMRGQVPGPGPWEWIGPVTVRSEDMVMTCKHLEVWPPKKGGEFERAEARGDIRIEGRRRDSNDDLWDIEGTAQSLVYDKSSASLVLEGAVSFTATNLTTEAVLSVDGRKLTFDLSKNTYYPFYLDAGPGKDRVHMKWQPPESEEEPAGPPAEQTTGGGDQS